MRVEVSVDAYEDIKAGIAFYDAQEPGVGRYFSSTIFADIRSLRNFAGIHPRRYGYFMMLVRRFPYAIYYDKIESNVVVVAVLDCRRNPLWIAHRIGRSSER